MDRSDLAQYKSHIMLCPLFQGMEESELLPILSEESVRLIHCSKGMLLDSDALYVVLTGCVLIEKETADGRFVSMGRAVPCAAVNAATVFLSGAPMSRMMAVEDSLLIRMEAQCLEKAVRAGGPFAWNLTVFLSNRIRFLNQKISSLAGYSASSRLQRYLEENASEGEVTIPMSLTEFAEFLGVGRASLYRTFEQMERDNRIVRKGRRIMIREL